MHGRGQPITLEKLPRNHREMRGLYSGETDEGFPFTLYVHSGTRRATGNEMMKAQITSMTRGRPLSSADLNVPREEIYIVVGNGHRKDIAVNPNGSYSHGNVFGRTFKEVVEGMLRAYGPRPAAPKVELSAEDPATSPKPF